MATTPTDTPSSPENYASVTPHGQGPAAYGIQAPMSDGEISAAFDSSVAVGGAGALYPQGPRQAQTQQLLESPAGFASGGYDIDAGTTAGWPNDVEPDVAGP
jgi:hypothetical protein